MKSRLLFSAVLLCVSLKAQVVTESLPSSPQLLERGPHSADWQSVSVSADESGVEIAVTNSWTEVATGLSYLKNGQYLPTQEAFQESPDGFSAMEGPHQLILTRNINAPASVDLLLPDGQRLRSNPMGLSFFDYASGNNVLLGEVKDCEGALVAPNVVVYADAFKDIQGALRYTYSKTGIEQDVILYGNPGSPQDFGLNPATTLVEMYSEFFSPPQPIGINQRTENGLQDVQLDFGQMAIGRGTAYVMGQELDPTPVFKTWSQIDGRDWLIESVPFNVIQPMLEKAGLTASDSVMRKKVGGRSQLMALAAMKPKTGAMRVASLNGRGMPKSGVVVDYSTINTSQTNQLFRGDGTFFISGNVSLYGTNTIFEGGTVLKYTNNVSLTVNTPVTWEGTPYRPIVLTARDDRSVGEPISPSNTLSGYYASAALVLDGNAASTNFILQNVRVANAQTAIAINGKAGHVITHAQLVSCQAGFSTTNADFSLRNALFDHVLTNFTGSTSTGRVEHLTTDTATWLNKDIGANLFLTNCLLVSVTSTGTFTGNTVYSTSAGGVFQTVGAGAHYLADGSPYRNIGTAQINSNLAVDLKRLTTYPPVVLTADFTTDTTLNPTVQRDIGTPTLGYHYDPLDFAWSGRNLTNATLTLTNGVAVAAYGNSGTILRNGARFISGGFANNLNRLVNYNTVQEQATTNWASTTALVNLSLLDLPTMPSPQPEIRLRFTDLSMLAATTLRRQLFNNSAGTSPGVLSLEHCQWRGLYLDGRCYTISGMTVSFTNNLIQRGNLSFAQQSSSGYQNYTLNCYNNLFVRGNHNFAYNSPGTTWTVKDNLFDCEGLTSGNLVVAADYNGYTSGLTSLGGTNNKTGLIPDYLIGPLGSFYYPTTGSSTSLTNLVDSGSRNATNAGLYHFTVRVDQTKETNSIVDIGFHYVAVDASGNPLDTDGDGIPDYLEDRNGNGTYEAGVDLTDWTLFDTDGDGLADGYDPNPTTGDGPTSLQSQTIPNCPVP